MPWKAGPQGQRRGEGQGDLTPAFRLLDQGPEGRAAPGSADGSPLLVAWTQRVLPALSPGLPSLLSLGLPFPCSWLQHVTSSPGGLPAEVARPETQPALVNF